MYNSDKYRIEFKLEEKDLMMMDNYRLLHGMMAVFKYQDGKMISLETGATKIPK